MLLPHEINIRNKTFSRALNGYSQSEVNAFLDYIAGKYEELYSENIELSGKLEAVQKELDKYQKDEEKQEAEIRKLLFDAQRVAAAMIAEAEGKAQKIIADAENTAKEKLSASVKDQAINESTLSRLYSEAEAFRAQLISMYEARLRELKSETFTPLDSDAINNITAVSVNADSGSDTDDNIDDIDVNDDNNVADTPEYDAPEEDIEIDEDIETTESASDNVVAEYDEDNAERSFAENSSVEPSSAEQSAAEQPPEEISEEPISDEPLSQDIPAETVDSAYIHSYNEPQLNEEEPEPAEDNDVPATDALGADFAGSEDGAEIEEILCINGSADTDYSELTPSPYERPEGDVFHAGRPLVAHALKHAEHLLEMEALTAVDDVEGQVEVVLFLAADGGRDVPGCVQRRAVAFRDEARWNIVAKLDDLGTLAFFEEPQCPQFFNDVAYVVVGALTGIIIEADAEPRVRPFEF